jgi:hypothetical protein
MKWQWWPVPTFRQNDDPCDSFWDFDGWAWRWQCHRIKGVNGASLYYRK